jgi:hypothetical protein
MHEQAGGADGASTGLPRRIVPERPARRPSPKETLDPMPGIYFIDFAYMIWIAPAMLLAMWA